MVRPVIQVVPIAVLAGFCTFFYGVREYDEDWHILGYIRVSPLLEPPTTNYTTDAFLRETGDPDMQAAVPAGRYRSSASFTIMRNSAELAPRDCQRLACCF